MNYKQSFQKFRNFHNRTWYFVFIYILVWILTPIFTASILYTFLIDAASILFILILVDKIEEDDWQGVLGGILFSFIISLMSFVLYNGITKQISYSDIRPAKISEFLSDEHHIVLDDENKHILIPTDKVMFYKLQSGCKPVYRIKSTRYFTGYIKKQIEMDCK